MSSPYGGLRGGCSKLTSGLTRSRALIDESCWWAPEVVWRGSTRRKHSEMNSSSTADGIV